MTPEELQREFANIGITCRAQKDEVLIETCYFCGNTHWNLELNAIRGLYHCWACNTGGRLDKLLHDWLGQTIYIPVHMPTEKHLLAAVTVTRDFRYKLAADVPLAMHYLARRGMTVDMIRQYDLVMCTESGHRLEGRLVCPLHDFWSGAVIGYVGRTITNKYPKYLSTLTTRHIVGYRVQSWRRACILVEGIFDAIIVHQANYHAAVLSGTNNPKVQEFVARIPADTPIIILLDGDALTAAEHLRWVVYPIHNNVLVITLPEGRDPADFTPAVLDQLITQALQTQITVPK